jgi:hypothetical protein
MVPQDPRKPALQNLLPVALGLGLVYIALDCEHKVNCLVYFPTGLLFLVVCI